MLSSGKRAGHSSHPPSCWPSEPLPAACASQGGAATHWPRWRAELLGGAPLLECLAGLLHSLGKGAAQGMPGAPEH